MIKSKRIVSADGTAFWVKESFRCVNPQNYHNYNLITEYQLAAYLHNERGPAIEGSDAVGESYWINGKHLDKNEWYRLSFGTKLEDIIGD